MMLTKTILVEYSLDSLSDITPDEFQAACERRAEKSGYWLEFRVGLHNRETSDGEPCDIIVQQAFADCCAN